MTDTTTPAAEPAAQGSADPNPPYPAPITPLAAADPAAERRLAILCWLVLAVFILVFHVFMGRGPLPPGQGMLDDNDSLVRAYRVLQIQETGAWFDPMLYRIDPPKGAEQHWTRIMDLPYLVSGWIGQVLTGNFRLGLEWGAAVIPPLLHVLFIAAIFWIGRPFMPLEARVMAAFLTMLHFATVAVFLPGRIDYHNTEILSAALMLGFAARLASRHVTTRTAWLAGLTGAIALWIGVETVLVLVVMVAAPALRWLLVTTEDVRSGRDFSRSLLLFLALAALAERGPYIFSVWNSFDKLCLMHVLAFTGPWLFWEAAALGHRFGWRPRLATRAGTAALGGLVSLVIIVALLPQLRTTGYLFPEEGIGSPVYTLVRGGAISENESIGAAASAQGVGMLEAFSWILLNVMAFLMGIVPLCWLLVKRRELRPLMLVCLAAVLVVWYHYTRGHNFEIPLRATYYVQTVMVIPAGIAIGWIVISMQTVMTAPSRRGMSIAICSLLLLLVTMGLIALGYSATEIADADKANRLAAERQAGAPTFVAAPVAGDAVTQAKAGQGFCDARLISDDVAREFPDGGVIAAHPDHGPFLLYYSRAGIVSYPNHRPQPGLDDLYEAMHAGDPVAARELLLRNFDMKGLVLCGAAPARPLFPVDDPQSFAGQLAAGQVPPWLQEISREGYARLYRIVPQAAAEGAQQQ